MRSNVPSIGCAARYALRILSSFLLVFSVVCIEASHKLRLNFPPPLLVTVAVLYPQLSFYQITTNSYVSVLSKGPSLSTRTPWPRLRDLVHASVLSAPTGYSPLLRTTEYISCPSWLRWTRCPPLAQSLRLVSSLAYRSRSSMNNRFWVIFNALRLHQKLSSTLDRDTWLTDSSY
jgi:hypothetical protein